jgi:cell division protease FtsH
MVTRYGMSDKYGMMALETVNGAYLGGDTSLACAPDTAADIDNEVRQMIADGYEKAKKIIADNRAQMDAAARILLEKETITGEEFMRVIDTPAQLVGETR